MKKALDLCAAGRDEAVPTGHRCRVAPLPAAAAAARKLPAALSKQCRPSGQRIAGGRFSILLPVGLQHLRSDANRQRRCAVCQKQRLQAISRKWRAVPFPALITRSEGSLRGIGTALLPYRQITDVRKLGRAPPCGRPISRNRKPTHIPRNEFQRGKRSKQQNL